MLLFSTQKCPACGVMSKFKKANLKFFTPHIQLACETCNAKVQYSTKGTNFLTFGIIIFGLSPIIAEVLVEESISLHFLIVGTILGLILIGYGVKKKELIVSVDS